MKGEENVYVCQKCGGLTVTLDRDQGTTPFMIGCRASGKEGDCDPPARKCGAPSRPGPSRGWQQALEIASADGEPKREPEPERVSPARRRWSPRRWHPIKVPVAIAVANRVSPGPAWWGSQSAAVDPGRRPGREARW